MEFQPEGAVTLRLEEWGEEYTWNKVGGGTVSPKY